MTNMRVVWNSEQVIEESVDTGVVGMLIFSWR